MPEKLVFKADDSGSETAPVVYLQGTNVTGCPSVRAGVANTAGGPGGLGVALSHPEKVNWFATLGIRVARPSGPEPLGPGM
jgi:hypothetical protein